MSVFPLCLYGFHIGVISRLEAISTTKMRTFAPLILFFVSSLAAPQIKQDNPLVAGTDATMDGVRLDGIPVQPAVAAVVSAAMPRDRWTVSCDSSQPGNECSNVVDGSADTFWLTESSAPLPHSIVIDMQTAHIVGNITIEPKQDGNLNGNIGQHQVYLRYVASESNASLSHA